MCFLLQEYLCVSKEHLSQAATNKKKKKEVKIKKKKRAWYQILFLLQLLIQNAFALIALYQQKT